MNSLHLTGKNSEPPQAKDFSVMTSMSKAKGTQANLANLYQRYRFARQFCMNKKVLDLGCSIGRGLGYLARDAQLVVGVDIHKPALEHARTVYRGRQNVQLQYCDAHDIALADRSIDVILIFQALYLMENADAVLAECHRLLTKGGCLIIATVNPRWNGFSRCLYSTKYHTGVDLCHSTESLGLATDLYGAFPTTTETLGVAARHWVRRAAARLDLIPRRSFAKLLLKRCFYGKLYEIGDEIDDSMADYQPPTKLSHRTDTSIYQILYTVSRRL